MKRFLAIILALALMLSCAAALAEGYPLVDSPAEFNLIIRVRPLHGDPDEMVFFKNLEELTGVHINWERSSRQNTMRRRTCCSLQTRTCRTASSANSP